MFLAVALVCPAFLNLFEQTCVRNCVLVCSASNDSDCWCVTWFRVRAGVAKQFFACVNHWFSIFCSHNVTSEITLANTFGQVGILFMRMSLFFLWMTAHIQSNWWATTLNGTCR